MISYKQAKSHFENELGSFILVEIEKYGNGYHVVESLEAYGEICLWIVKQRWDDGNYYFEPETPETPSVDKETIEKMKDGYLKNQAIEEHKNYERQLKEYEQEVKFYNLLVDLLIENKLEVPKKYIAAINILLSRNDHEYEEIRVEYPVIRDV